MSVNIHGKEYVTVAERVQEAHKELDKITITTEVLPTTGVIVIKATVTTPKGVFTGISAANPTKTIEKMSPYEVAETSAVGRALGFAGFGSVDSIASADEMNKSVNTPDPTAHWNDEDLSLVNPDGVDLDTKDEEPFCSLHKKFMKERTAKDGSVYYDHRWTDTEGNWHKCNGKGGAT